MITVNESNTAINLLLAENSHYSVPVLGGRPKDIKLPQMFSLNTSIVEDYFYSANDQDEVQDNAWDYICRWIDKHQKAYSISVDDGLLNVSILTAPLEAYLNLSIFYAKKEDAMLHCAIHFSYVSDYKNSITDVFETAHS
jgi:hypothetical protein